MITEYHASVWRKAMTEAETGEGINAYVRAEVARAVAAERERCAKLVEEMDVSGHDGYIETSGDMLVALAGCIRLGA